MEKFSTDETLLLLRNIAKVAEMDDLKESILEAKKIENTEIKLCIMAVLKRISELDEMQDDLGQDFNTEFDESDLKYDLEYVLSKIDFPTLIATLDNSEEMFEYLEIYSDILDLSENFELFSNSQDANLLMELINSIKDNRGAVGNIRILWNHTNRDVQKERIAEIIEEVKNSENAPNLLRIIWRSTDKEAQRENSNLLIEIMNLIKDGEKAENFIEKIWNDTDTEVQKETITEIINFVKNNEIAEVLVRNIWSSTDKELQEEKILEVIEEVKGGENTQDLIRAIWFSTDKDVQKERIAEIIENVKDGEKAEVLIRDIWNSTYKEIQREKITEIIEKIKDGENVGKLIRDIWYSTDKEVQRENPELLMEIVNLVKNSEESEYLVRSVWYSTDKEIQRQKILEMIEEVKNCKNAEDLLKAIWYTTDKEVQKENSNLLIEIVNLVKNSKNSETIIKDIWHSTDKEIQREKILEIIEEVKDCENAGAIIKEIWQFTDKEVQKENPNILTEIINLIKDSENAETFIKDFWKFTDKEAQRENPNILTEIINLARNSENAESFIKDIWYNTDKELQRKKITETIDQLRNDKNAGNLVNAIWSGAYKDVQRENPNLLIEIINLVKNNENAEDLINGIWYTTDKELQREKITEILEEIKENQDLESIIPNLWIRTDPSVRLKKFDDVFKTLRESSDTRFYESFVKSFLGEEIDFRKDGTPIVPEELKNAFSSIEDKDHSERIIKQLPSIIKNWIEVKQYIQQKRANSVIGNGIEIRANSTKEILGAIDAFCRTTATTPSAQEFESLSGSERVGRDTQFTISPITAVQRAHTLAEKMDLASTQKKYPDFSVKSKDGKTELKVLHPQDKSAIMLGFDTRCCFRPNGNADKPESNGHSLLQYCTTTPYGGVLRCESTDKKEIYMGSPFLVNGNCMMFHSYETSANSESNATKCNKLLIESAKKAIQDSRGTIDVVFMTNLYIGKGRLDASDKIVLPSYFRAYTEGELSEYSNMYTNLDSKNCILAARVGDRILTGRELLEWYERECNGDPEELKQKLNLHMGERTQESEEFDFGRREIISNLEIAEPQLARQFLNRKKGLEQERESLALSLQIKKLEEKDSELTDSERTELAILKEKQGDSKKYETESIDAIRNRIQQNFEEQLALYSGKDIDLIAETLGIDIESKLRKKVEKSMTSRAPQNSAKSKAGQIISQLIARTNDSDDKKVKGIENLKQKIARKQLSEEELAILEQAGININPYRKMLQGDESKQPTEQQVAQQINQQVQKRMKDTAQKEAVVAEILFKDVTEEEIDSKKRENLRVSLIDELKRKITMITLHKDIEQLTEQEMEKVDEEVRVVHINDLVTQMMEGTLSAEQEEALSQYGIEPDAHIKKVRGADEEEEKQVREKLIRDIRKDKLEKLKAQITIGLETKTKMSAIMKRVEPTSEPSEEIDKLLYGNSWYIALDSEGRIIGNEKSKKLDERGTEQQTYEKVLEEYKKREEQERIKVDSIRRVTEPVSVLDKKAELDQIGNGIETERAENVREEGGEQL